MKRYDNKTFRNLNVGDTFTTIYRGRRNNIAFTKENNVYASYQMTPKGPRHKTVIRTRTQIVMRTSKHVRGYPNTILAIAVSLFYNPHFQKTVCQQATTKQIRTSCQANYVWKCAYHEARKPRGMSAWV